MTILERAFTLLVAGRPIISFYASSYREAQELTREAWLRTDLLHHRSGKDRLWDGKARLSVRQANDEEQKILALADKSASDDDGLRLAYLVALEKGEPRDEARHYEGNDVRSPSG